jgi:hypothetical protein
MIMSKFKKSELIEQRKKLIIDLVDFAAEWKKLKPALSVSGNALGNFALVDEMSNEVLSLYTKEKSFEAIKED